jgi:hypothetical protein
MTGHGLVGLVLALLVEGSHWTRLRWDFDELAAIRAWRISVIAIALAIIWLWFEGNPYMAVPRALGWMPALLLPLQFVQSYGLRDTMWLRTFTFFSQQQRERNLRYGTALSEVRFNFGHVYLIAILLGSTPLGTTPESSLFLPGLVVLTGWALLASRRCRWPHVVVLMGVAWLGGVAGQYGLDQAYRWYNYGMRNYQSHLVPDHFRTAIGRLGEIKQSPDIVWRLRPLPGSAVPTHLRTLSYNRYCSGLWSNMPQDENAGITAEPVKKKHVTPKKDGYDDAEDRGFDPVEQLEMEVGKFFHRLPKQGGLELLHHDSPRFSLRGEVSNRSSLPVPGNAVGLLDFDVEAFDSNLLGTVRIFPKATVVDGTVVWNDRSTHESPPWPEVDMGIDKNDLAAVRQVVAGLRLDEVPTLSGKLQVIRRFFQDFEYTRYNSIKDPRVGALRGSSAISVFLTKVRRGHCEYFATAACLLLREAGIPSRYAIGYVVSEKNAKRGEWVIRGLHGHAWTRVWDQDAGIWRDFDPTPASWLAAEAGDGRSLQWLWDATRRLNEDFTLWRSRPLNRWLVSGSMILIGTTGLLFILRRLWKSRQQVGPRGGRGQALGAGVRTPLHQLEKAAARHLPPRSTGQPFGAWLGGLEGSLPDSSMLTEAIELHQRLRFDPAEPAPAVSERLKHLTTQLEATLKRRRTRSWSAPTHRRPS